MKFFFTALLLGLLVTPAIGQATISSFTPTSGIAGSQVTITGTGFSTIQSENIVRFGPVSATVTSASATQLVVEVPVGATYGSIAVTTTSGTVHSNQLYLVTFAGTETPFISTSYLPAVNFSTDNNPEDIKTGDIDGDGKPDIVVTGKAINVVSVFRNTSSTGVLTFTEITFETGEQPVGVVLGDVNNDGKLDIIVANEASSTISVFKNTSTPGAISFIGKVDFATGPTPQSIGIGDLNGDGKLDVVTASFSVAHLAVLQNTSTAGAITFAAKQDIALSDFPTSIATGDLNNDQKDELVVAHFNPATISVYPNTSTGGTISFATRKSFGTSASPVDVKIADIDLDSKPDLVTAGAEGVSILTNATVSASDIQFIDLRTLGLGNNQLYQVEVADLNGDALADIAAVNVQDDRVSVKLQSAEGSFGPTIQYAVGTNPFGLKVCDYDGDHHPDIATVNANSRNVSLLRYVHSSFTSFEPAAAESGQTVTLHGVNLTGASAVKFGTTEAASFTVVSPTVVTAVVGNGSSGNVFITTPGGTHTLAGFAYIIPVPTISTFDPASGATGTTITITGTNFTGASVVSFGSTPAQSFTVVSATTITAVVGFGSSGNVSVTTPGGTHSLAGFTFIPAPVINSFDPANGVTGNMITITGTNFTGASAVSFGSTPAQSFTVVSATIITAVVGEGSTGKISIVTPGGMAISSTDFTFGVITSIETPKLLKSVRVYPNPSSGKQLHLSLPGLSVHQKISIWFTDVNGRMLHMPTTIDQEESGVTINFFASPPPGMYILIINLDKEVICKHVMIK